MDEDANKDNLYHDDVPHNDVMKHNNLITNSLHNHSSVGGFQEGHIRNSETSIAMQIETAMIAVPLVCYLSDIPPIPALEFFTCIGQTIEMDQMFASKLELKKKLYGLASYQRTYFIVLKTLIRI